MVPIKLLLQRDNSTKPELFKIKEGIGPVKKFSIRGKEAKRDSIPNGIWSFKKSNLNV